MKQKLNKSESNCKPMFRLLPQVAALGCAFTLCAWAKHPKIAGDLDLTDPKATVEVIVQYNAAPTQADNDKVKSKGGQLKTDLSSIKGGHYSVKASELQALADDPNVRFISPDRAVSGLLDYANPTINADVVQQQYGYKGSGITIAVLDSGQKNTPDLTCSIPGHGPCRVIPPRRSIASRLALEKLL